MSAGQQGRITPRDARGDAPSRTLGSGPTVQARTSEKHVYFNGTRFPISIPISTLGSHLP